MNARRATNPIFYIYWKWNATWLNDTVALIWLFFLRMKVLGCAGDLFLLLMVSHNKQFPALFLPPTTTIQINLIFLCEKHYLNFRSRNWRKRDVSGFTLFQQTNRKKRNEVPFSSFRGPTFLFQEVFLHLLHWSSSQYFFFKFVCFLWTSKQNSLPKNQPNSNMNYQLFGCFFDTRWSQSCNLLIISQLIIMQ